jgi:hypothetical protein
MGRRNPLSRGHGVGPSTTRELSTVLEAERNRKLQKKAGRTARLIERLERWSNLSAKSSAIFAQRWSALVMKVQHSRAVVARLQGRVGR